MADYSMKIQGFQEAMEAMLKATAAIKPTGAMGAAVKEALFMVQAYASKISHIWTSTLKRSHLIQYDGASGFVYPSPYNINPLSKKPPSFYGPIEESKGGDHAFYGQTVSQRGQAILNKTGQSIMEELYY